MAHALHWFIKSTTYQRCSLAVLLFSLFFLSTTVSAAAPIMPDQAMAPRSGVLMPLYIYPVQGAWDPLFKAIQTHPSLDFTVVINPASGPGASPLPDSNYTSQITKLNTYSNVRTIGYVALNYGKRPLAGAYADVAQYAQWGVNNPGLAMQGIFLDESPQLATDQNTTFLADVKTRIKATSGLSSGAVGKIPTIVMNPGSIPDSRILGTTDKTVVFEEQYQTYINRQSAKALAALPDRDVLCCLVHSIPTDISVAQLKSIVGELRELAGSIFLTDLSTDYYQNFSPRFQEYIDAML